MGKKAKMGLFGSGFWRRVWRVVIVHRRWNQDSGRRAAVRWQHVHIPSMSSRVVCGSKGELLRVGYDQMLFIRVIDHFVTVYKRMFWVVGTKSIFVGSVNGKIEFQN